MNALDQMLQDSGREVKNNTSVNTPVNTKSNTVDNTPVNTTVNTTVNTIKPKLNLVIRDKTVVISLRISQKRLDKITKKANQTGATRQAIIDALIDECL